jgi:hypothetical protein
LSRVTPPSIHNHSPLPWWRVCSPYPRPLPPTQDEAESDAATAPTVLRTQELLSDAVRTEYFPVPAPIPRRHGTVPGASPSLRPEDSRGARGGGGGGGGGRGRGRGSRGAKVAAVQLHGGVTVPVVDVSDFLSGQVVVPPPSPRK